MSKTDDGVRAGFLLLTLKDYNLGFSNTFIGEAAIPLSSLPCVDSSQVHTVANSCLTMTTPGLDIGELHDIIHYLFQFHHRNAKMLSYLFSINDILFS